jgi:hypothetical protein
MHRPCRPRTPKPVRPAMPTPTPPHPPRVRPTAPAARTPFPVSFLRNPLPHPARSWLFCRRGCGRIPKFGLQQRLTRRHWLMPPRISREIGRSLFTCGTAPCCIEVPGPSVEPAFRHRRESAPLPVPRRGAGNRLLPESLCPPSTAESSMQRTGNQLNKYF